MLIRKASGIRPSEITPETVYRERRELLARAIAAGVIGAAGPAAHAAPTPVAAAPVATLKYQTNARYSVKLKPNTVDEITHYNNFYDFGPDKTDPAYNAGGFKPHPWSVQIAGVVGKTGTITL